MTIWSERSGGGRGEVETRAAYDAVARHYVAQFGDELEGKPLDRALLGSLVELVGAGTIADVGCGPGHVTRFLAAQHPQVIGLDLSPGMIAIAHECAPELSFAVGSMLALPAADGAWSGAVALYSIIHFDAGDRAIALRELARTLRTGGWLLIAFHVDSEEFATGDINHVTTWFGQPVQLDGYFLEPAEITNELETADFAVVATVERHPSAGEYPSRRCYLLAQRR